MLFKYYPGVSPSEQGRELTTTSLAALRKAAGLTGSELRSVRRLPVTHLHGGGTVVNYTAAASARL